MERKNLNTNELLSTLLGEFYERSLPTIYRRHVKVPQIPNKIMAVIGMRRTGKTYFLYQQIQELLKQGINKTAILYLNFEDDRLERIDTEYFASLIEEFYKLYPENHNRTAYFFFDEIQNIDGWPKVLRRFLDTRKTKIWISGSSAKMLGREIATSLRGRCLSIEMWPFDFNEFLESQNFFNTTPLKSPAHQAFLQKHLLDFINQGGMPETLSLTPLDRRRIHQDYVQVVILRDIIERYKIKNEELIHTFIRLLLTYSSCNLSFHKLYLDFKSQGRKIGKNTLYQYMDYIQDCYLAFTTSIYTRSIRKQYSNPKKVYLVDTGIARSYQIVTKGNLGQLFENRVYLDLRRHQYEVFYYQTKTGKEVDFLAISPNGNTYLIQVCWDISSSDTKNRELSALAEAKKEHKAKGLLVTPNSYLDFLRDL